MKLTRTHIKRMILESLLNEDLASAKNVLPKLEDLKPLLHGAVQDVIANATKDEDLAAVTDELGKLNEKIRVAINVAIKDMQQRLMK
jgi:hypothetical protein